MSKSEGFNHNKTAVVTNGIITEHKLISGCQVYKLFHTHGLPLEIALDELNKKNVIVDWYGYFKTALDENMVIENEYNKVKNAVFEVFGKDYFEEWDKRAKIVLLKLLRGDGNYDK